MSPSIKIKTEPSDDFPSTATRLQQSVPGLKRESPTDMPRTAPRPSLTDSQLTDSAARCGVTAFYDALNECMPIAYALLCYQRKNQAVLVGHLISSIIRSIQYIPSKTTSTYHHDFGLLPLFKYAHFNRESRLTNKTQTNHTRLTTWLHQTRALTLLAIPTTTPTHLSQGLWLSLSAALTALRRPNDYTPSTGLHNAIETSDLFRLMRKMHRELGRAVEKAVRDGTEEKLRVVEETGRRVAALVKGVRAYVEECLGAWEEGDGERERVVARGKGQRWV